MARLPPQEPRGLPPRPRRASPAVCSDNCLVNRHDGSHAAKTHYRSSAHRPRTEINDRVTIPNRARHVTEPSWLAKAYLAYPSAPCKLPAMDERPLTSFGIGSFLSFAKQEPVDLGQLNVFVGRNSSGKSTVLHALALLAETLADDSPYTSMLFAGNGLNLGTFRDVVHGNDVKKTIVFDLALPMPDVTGIAAGELAPEQVPVRVRVCLKHDAESRRPYASAASVYSADGNRCFTLQGNPQGRSGGYQVGSFGRKPSSLVARFNHFLPIFQSQQQKKRRPNWATILPFLSVNDFGRYVAKVFGDLVYLGPSRAALDAIYIPAGRFPEKLDSAASNLVPYILGRLRTARIRKRFRRTLNKWLRDEFELVSDARLQPLRSGYGFRLEGTDPDVAATVSLANTGYGVSQILPLLVELAIGTPGLLLIEQPEIHLHPRAQSKLGDLLIAFMKAGYQLLVETHSEHLIYRLRALVAETADLHQQVRLFHVDKTELGSRLRPVGISETGQLNGWPKGFFSASAADILQILRRGT